MKEISELSFPEDVRYTEEHEWAKKLEGEKFRVGITDYAQDQLGDIVFVEVPEVGRKIKAGEACAVVESVKTASDIYSPLSGEVVEANRAVVDNPGLVNTEPYGGGWFFTLRLSVPTELNGLLGPEQYSAQIKSA